MKHSCPEGVDIATVDIFSGLGAEDLAALSSLVSSRRCAPGEALFTEGEEGSELYAILSGSVTVSVRLPDGKDLAISQACAGDFFGEMSLIERAPRSATCRASEETECLVLGAEAFDRFMAERPHAAFLVMDRMLAIAAGRLVRTGSFLSQMVQWGEASRKRAVTDAATGLLNRRYLDDNLEGLVARARAEGRQLSLAMFDMDHFGDLNKLHGLAFGDEVIKASAEVFRKVFREGDILIRFGGDEFVFVLPDAGPAEAQALLDALCAAVRAMRFPGKEGLGLSCSLGFASLPEHAQTAARLREKADKALYAAKEAGRDRAAAAEPDPKQEGAGPKREIRTIAEKNRAIKSIVEALSSHERFLVLGHANPDEDCVASMVAFSLLAVKFGKQAILATCSQVHEQFRYLLNICRYNGIQVLEGCVEPPEQVDVVVVLDTPKPSMVEPSHWVDSYRARARDRRPAILEIDHHLEADSRYAGDPGLRLVTGASSTCELIGLLCLKIANDPPLIERFQLGDLFSRNLVLAILTGIIGDSRMGKYLKTRRERWYYEWFSGSFEKMLAQKTIRGTGNYASKEEVFNAIASLSGAEEACYRYIMERARKGRGLSWAALGPEESAFLFREFGTDTVVSVAKAITDAFAEGSGSLGMLAFYDDPTASDFCQFKLRRSQAFTSLDLRDVLIRLGIENGGGHPGAVGFRFPKGEVPDIVAKAGEIVRELESMAGGE